MSSTADEFPQYASTDEVECFACHRGLPHDTPEDAGYAPGRGQYRAHCPACRLWTCFDLKETPR